MSGPLVKVTAAAPSRRLVALTTLKTALGISGSGEDTDLQRWIDGASRVLSALAGRPLWWQSYQEKRPGDGGIYLELSRYPVSAIASIYEGDDTVSTNEVTASTYSLRFPAKRQVYREDGWTSTAEVDYQRLSSVGGRALDYTVNYDAGYVMPDQVTEWAASTAYSVGDWVDPVEATDPDSMFLFRCTVAGTSDSTEPTWPSVEAGTVADSTATWTAYAQALPEPITEALLVLVRHWRAGGLDVGTYDELSFENMRMKFNREQRYVSQAVKNLLWQGDMLAA